MTDNLAAEKAVENLQDMQAPLGKRKYFNRTVKRVILSIVSAMALLSLILYYKVGSANISAYGAANIAISISGLLLTTALFSLTTADHRPITRRDAYFLATLAAISLCCFFNELGWLANGHQEMGKFLYGAEILLTIFGQAMIYCFYQYLLSTVFADKKESLKPVTIVLIIIMCIIIALSIINLFTGIIFSVDEAGNQVAGPLVFLLYLEMTYSIWLLAFVWAFIVIYDENRRKLENKQRDIDVADSVLHGILPKPGEDIELDPKMKAFADAHTIPDAMKLTEILTRERVRRIAEICRKLK